MGGRLFEEVVDLFVVDFDIGDPDGILETVGDR